MIKKSILALCLLIFAAINANCEDYTKYVNPFIGTGGHGHTYPGPCAPFGMVQLSPDTRLTGWDGCSAYHYTDSICYGFSHTHLSGTGCSDYGDILLMPGIPKTKEPSATTPDFRLTFSHNNETAEPGYYSIKFDNSIKVQLSVTPRAGFHKYSFPKGKDGDILIDLKHRDEVIESELRIINDTVVAGFRRSRAWARDQHVYFYAVFSKPFRKSDIYINNALTQTGKTINDKDLKCVLKFDNPGEILVRIGISGTSIDGAMKNLYKEIPSFDFDRTRAATKEEWNKYLSKIEITAPEDVKQVFYSAFYHSAIVPNIYSDVDGSYRGRDLQIHKTDGFDYYTVFSLWDTYRAENPLLTLIDRKRTNDFIKTFLEQYRYGGRLPVWELSSNETDCMIGYHAVPVIADAFIKGIKDFDKEEMWEAIRHSSNINDYRGIGKYISTGFLQVEDEGESVSKTLEYAYDDWCIAQVAKTLGKADFYTEYIQRAQSYKNLFDPTTRFMRPRQNGAWYKPFDPFEVNNNYTEANAWQYSFYVPQDLTTLISLHGGFSRFELKLDEMFNASAQTTGREQSDISGLIGQYAHGNEPSHHMSYLYNYVGAAWKTQEKVAEITQNLYSPKPDGLCGNEDCGQMSAWYLFSAIGFYPVCPASMDYIIGTPAVEKAVINLESGKQFIIKALNYSKKNIYIQSATLNGKTYSKSYIQYIDIVSGGELVFNMGSKPNKSWGVGNDDIPKSSIDESLITPAPYLVNAPRAFHDSLELQLECTDKNTKILYNIDGTNPASMMEYNHPIMLRNSAILHFSAATYGKEPSKLIEAKFNKFANNYKIKVLTKYNNQYTAGGDEGLIDGIRGTEEWRKGGWQGHSDSGFAAIINLREEKNIKLIGAGFLQDVRSWIWMPQNIEILVSDDGLNFRKVADIPNTVPQQDYNVQTRDYTKSFDNLKCHYIKIIAPSIGTIPYWHPGAGEKRHLFIDEIIIE